MANGASLAGSAEIARKQDRIANLDGLVVDVGAYRLDDTSPLVAKDGRRVGETGK